MINETLSERIVKMVELILEQWKRDYPNDDLLSMAQQVNLSSVAMKRIGTDFEEEFKRRNKGKTTNALH